jgi:hypothetical protein
MVTPYLSTLKYLHYNKDADQYVHVKLFQAIVRANGKTSKEYIINAFNYTLRKMTSDWCHN